MDGNGPGPASADASAGRALSDDALDRELAAALDVDPSPEFVARVRTRIAAEPAAAGTGLLTSWTWWAPAAAVLVLAVAIVLWRAAGPEERDVMAVATGSSPPQSTAAAVPGKGQAPQLPRHGGGEPVSEPGVESPRPVPRTTPPLVARPVAGEPGDEPPFRNVMISQDEVRALRMLVEVATVSARRDPAAVEVPEEDAELAEIEIAPVVIEPLAQMARLEL